MDAKIQSDGLRYSPTYAGLLALSVRQVLAATEITLPQAASGSSWNTSDVKSFTKAMGTTGIIGYACSLPFPANGRVIYLLPLLSVSMMST